MNRYLVYFENPSFDGCVEIKAHDIKEALLQCIENHPDYEILSISLLRYDK